MIIIPPPTNYRKPRRIKARRKTAPAPVLPPIVVTAITYAGMSGGNLVVEFRVDTTEEDPLEVSGASPAKWTASYGGTAFTGAMVQTLSFDELSITLSPGAASAGSEVRYAADPSDIGTASGRMLAAFEREI